MGSGRQQQRNEGGRRAVSDRRCALAIAALLALLWQSFVFQTHVHLPASPIAHQATTAHQAGEPDDDTDCPICLEGAQSGNYLTPGDLALPLPPARIAIGPIARIALWAGRHTPPGWTSRGPPSPLQDR